MTPFYERHGVTLYAGSALDVLPRLRLDPRHVVVITDPVWPNMPERLRDAYGLTMEPEALWARFCSLLPEACRRIVVQLGVGSDPRFLSSIPACLPFVRTCWLRYAQPSYQGTILNSGDVAYVFGDRDAPPGQTLLPGEVTASRVAWDARRRTKHLGHPTPRRLEHVRWLVRHFTRQSDLVLDPFAGSGTTLQAAREQGRRCLGIEINEAFCAGAVRRFDQEPLFPPEVA